MSRPHDWHVLDLPGDPTPGEPYSIRALARSAGTVADDAQQAHSAVRALAGDGAVLSWIGAAGEVFRGALHDFPSQLDKLHRSYEQAAGALSRWAGLLEDAQHQADRALAQGRQARAEIDALTAQLSAARADASRAATTSRRLSDVPAGGPPPDPAQVRAATAAASAAGSRVAGLDSALSDAHARLHAATRLAQQARELRKDGARRTRHELDDASDAGIQPKSRWQKFKDAVAKAWHITVQIATVVAIVVAVVALFVGGPIVWGILLAASAVLLADSLLKYANGEGSLWDVGLAALGVIPGGKLLTGLGKIIGTVKAGEHVLAAGARGLARGRTVLQGMTRAVRNTANRFTPRFVYNGKFAPPRAGAGPQHYDPVYRPGPLHDPQGGYVGRQGGTFRGGAYTGEVLEEPMVVHRYYGGPARENGSFWTPGHPAGPGQAQYGNAIKPEWNDLTEVSVQTVPRGTTIYRGPAAPQTLGPEVPHLPGQHPPYRGPGELLGGDDQIFLPELPKSWGLPGHG